MAERWEAERSEDTDHDPLPVAPVADHVLRWGVFPWNSSMGVADFEDEFDERLGVEQTAFRVLAGTGVLRRLEDVQQIARLAEQRAMQETINRRSLEDARVADLARRYAIQEGFVDPHGLSF